MKALARPLWVALAFLVVLALPVSADPDYPAFTGLVVDNAHVLSDPDKASLTQKLTDLQTKTGIQFAVATVPSLGGDEIENYANALFRKWGIGQKGVDNGLLLLLAPNERKLRFEVGRGLEGTMTDLQSKLILHNTMVPKLKAGDPAGALKAGVDDAIKVLNGDKSVARPPARQAAQDEDPLTFFFMFGFGLLVFGIIFLSIWRSARRQGRWGRSGGGVAPWIIGSGIGSSGGSSWSSDSSSGGDSFGGGGGGDSGGGGSSDSY